MSTYSPDPSSRPLSQSVLVLCADDELAEEVIRDLAERRYQPLIGWPGLNWASMLEWARPVAAVVDAKHPAAKSARFLAVSDDLEVGLVVVGEPVDLPPPTPPRRSAAASVPVADARLIGGAVDDTVRRRSI